MKRHLFTIILLLLAAIAFVVRFCVEDKWQICCDVLAFTLPTLAALVEIFLAEKSEKRTATEIKTLKENQLSVYVEDHKAIFEKGV